jgi:tetratricopeptide (TPR) repeat protein
VLLPLITPRWAKSEWTRYETYVHDAVIPVLAEGKAEEVMLPPLRRWNAVVLDPLVTDEAGWQTLLAAIRVKLAEPAPERALRIVDLPYPANPFFTGRDADLARVHEELQAAPVAALIQGRVRALAAMGGIGKTTLANEYARRYWRLYPQILWVDARGGLERGFALLFGKLFPGRSDAGLQQPDRAKLALAELSGRADRLLVLDNVEDAQSVLPWLPRDPTTGCRTLITSRFADWPTAAGIRAVQLEVLESEPSREFLLARTGRTAEGPERAACDDLARELSYLPLALEQAAAYIAAPGAGADFAGYLRFYREATAELLARGALGSTEYPDPGDHHLAGDSDETVAGVPRRAAAVRLVCGYTDPSGAGDARGQRRVGAGRLFWPGAATVGPAAAELRMHDALTGLARYSMTLGGTDMTFRMHGLVQAVERVHAEADGAVAETRDRALTRLTDLFPDAPKDPAQWPLCRLLLPHQQVLLTHPFPDSAADRSANLLSLAGSFLQASGDVAAALPLCRHALETCERVLGDEHPDTLIGVNNLAECLRELGDAAAALPLHQRALESRERVLVKEHPQTLLSVNNLSGCLFALGDAAAALPLLQRALESYEQVLGKEHPDTLANVNNLAQCLRALGDAAAALPLHQRALESSERVLGKEHPRTLISVNDLAECLRSLGDAAAALPLYTRALESREQVLGKDHPDTLISVNNLALCLLALGDAAAALPLYRRALESSERVLGKEHPHTLTTLDNLARCLRELGDAAAALSHCRRALESRERVLGKEHPDALTTLDNLAECLRELGDAAEALPLFRRAADGFEKRFGPHHPGSRSARAKCDQLEHEVAAAQAGPPRQSAANSAEIKPEAEPW